METITFEQLVTFGICIASVISLRQAFIQTQAMWDEEDASVTFHDWREHNPGVYLGLSFEGRRLISLWLVALERYMHTHPFCDCEWKRMWILELLNDLPPNSPKSFPILERHKALVFIF